MKKIILVTGSSDGLGKAIATKFASELSSDCEIILHYNSNADKCNKLAKQLESDYGCSTYTIKANFSDLKDIEKMTNQIISKYGKVDILINNAAVVYDADLEERTWKMFEETLKVNLIAPFQLSKTFGLIMKEMEQGTIINIASTNGIDYNSPYSLDYDASKAGIISLTKNMASLLGNKVNVNCVAPHWMNTEMNKDLPEDFLKEESNKILKGRFAEPAEVAELVYFLASEKAQYLTGQVYSFGSYKY